MKYNSLLATNFEPMPFLSDLFNWYHNELKLFSFIAAILGVAFLVNP